MHVLTNSLYTNRVMFLPSVLRQPDATDNFECDPHGPLARLRLLYGGLCDSSSEIGIPAELLPIPYAIPPQKYNIQKGDLPWTWTRPQEGIDSRGRSWAEVYDRPTR
jgi:hypothetical protein